jgi:hypothetical protein
MKRSHVAATVATLALGIGGWLWLSSSEAHSVRSARPKSASARTASPVVRSAATGAAFDPSPVVEQPAGGKAMTPARSALNDSRPPVVAGLSIDLQGSPREQLLRARTQRIDPARSAQLDRLRERSRARINVLREQLATAEGAERAELEAQLAVLESNDAWRSRVVSPTVRSASRPGSERL